MLAARTRKRYIRDMAYAVFHSVQYPEWLAYAVSQDKIDQLPTEYGPWVFLHIVDDLPDNLGPRRQACLLGIQGQGWCFITDRRRR
jgi:hypothetical protein